MTTRLYLRLLNHPYLIILFSSILIITLPADRQEKPDGLPHPVH